MEIFEDHVIATIEIEAIKDNKRIDYWTTPNTYVVVGGVNFCKVRGYYINGRIEQCGHDHQWGWSDVKKGEKRYYKLYFKGTIPSGVTTISIVDRGIKKWSEYGESLIHSYCFNNYTINNPRKNFSEINSEYLAKRNIDTNNDGICGIYEQIGGEQNYKLACVKESGEYKLIYLSCTTGRSWWQAGDIKANLKRSASGIFKADWAMSDKSINRDTYIIFDDYSMTVAHMTGTDTGETKYLKMYPTTPSGATTSGSSIEKNTQEWTGTGFALTDGYIVTNNHVINGAKEITVLGVNGDFNIEYRAYVVAVDKNNDLALIKINDNRFTGFSTIPYSVSNRICEVGEDVFVLGYPLTNYMGDEVKLTNGIISSRSGYQGDISTYQISAPVQPGNSGGPMFDSNGNVVGIVNAGIPSADNVGYAIKTSYLYSLVGSALSTSIIPQGNRVHGGSLADMVKRVKLGVFYIRCKGDL
ncbi:MAG: trypsin-like peptidase domain-containing protein [Bacteroidia bacterium]|nr:trypsin-like peptidase domain-containing protein [Bacteroidia bacterium]